MADEQTQPSKNGGLTAGDIGCLLVVILGVIGTIVIATKGPDLAAAIRKAIDHDGTAGSARADISLPTNRFTTTAPTASPITLVEVRNMSSR